MTNQNTIALQTQGDVRSSPIVASNGLIFFGDEAGWVYCLSPNGTIKWTVQVENFAISNSPALSIDESILYVVCDATLYALSVSGGKGLWKHSSLKGDFNAPSPSGDYFCVL
jgi:outer membrane protein assembly factor BamB